MTLVKEGNWSWLTGSGMVWVLAVFAGLVGVNLLTQVAGTERVLDGLRVTGLGPLLSAFVFDTWGTVGGLIGVVIFFVPVLYGVEARLRWKASAIFLVSGVAVGYVVSAAWNLAFAVNQTPSVGSSAIAIAAQGAVFTLAVFGLGRMWTAGRSSPFPEEGWYLASVYLVIVSSTLFFVFILQPVFVPSALYNWRVHGATFLLSVATAGLLAGISSLGRVQRGEDRRLSKSTPVDRATDATSTASNQR